MPKTDTIKVYIEYIEGDIETIDSINKSIQKQISISNDENGKIFNVITSNELITHNEKSYLKYKIIFNFISNFDNLSILNILYLTQQVINTKFKRRISSSLK